MVTVNEYFKKVDDVDAKVLVIEKEITVLDGNKITSPDGGEVEQVLALESINPKKYKWMTVQGGAGATWGKITGVLSDQKDLQVALDAKLPRIESSADFDKVYVRGKDGADTSMIVAEQMDSKGLAIAAIVKNYVDTQDQQFVPKNDIINDVITGGATKVLSAEQGKILNEEKQDKLPKVINNMYLHANKDTGSLEWVEAGSGSVKWGGIAGTLSDQKDLQVELDKKPEADLRTEYWVPGYMAVVGTDHKLTGYQMPFEDVLRKSTDIVNDLTTGGSKSVLSAEQGKALDIKKLNNAEITGGKVGNFLQLKSYAPDTGEYITEWTEATIDGVELVRIDANMISSSEFSGSIDMGDVVRLQGGGVMASIRVYQDDEIIATLIAQPIYSPGKYIELMAFVAYTGETTIAIANAVVMVEDGSFKGNIANIGGGAVKLTWGSITGDIADQSDLSKELTSKQDVASLEESVAKAGFTKNIGDVSVITMNGETKTPVAGIVDLGDILTKHQDISGKQDKSTLDADVQSLGFVKSSGVTGITMNGTPMKIEGGVADLGTVITEHQSLSDYAQKVDVEQALGYKQNQITCGTEAPEGGKDGDVYIKYTV